MFSHDRTRNGDEIYPPNHLAKKLSNRASFLITIGNHDESIVLLTKALKQNRRIDTATNTEPQCSCKSCSLEYCVGMEKGSYDSLLNREKEEYNHGQNKKQNDNCQLQICRDKDDEDGDMECDHHRNCREYQHQSLAYIENQDGFVYRWPIIVPKLCIEEGHYMGFTLDVIILYNLALAHHLKTLSMDTKDSKQVLSKSLKLYELAYQLHLDSIRNPESQTGNHPKECNEGTVGYLRFTIIISNNLGQIHRVAGNSEKHKKCLHHLLSTIMYMVDNQVVNLDSSEMDGFYRNVSNILGHCICAKAA